MEKNPATQEQTGYELMSRELINRKTAAKREQDMSWELTNGTRNLLEYGRITDQLKV